MSSHAKKARTYTPACDFIPDEGIPQKIAEGIYWLRLPLPFELKHVNLWLLEGADGWSIVDTGFNYPVITEHWENVFRKFFAGKKVENIFITHFHPDHFGLAGWLAEKTGVTPHMTRAEYFMVQSLMDAEKLREIYAPYYVEAGLSPAEIAEMMEKRLTYKKIVVPPPPVRHVKAGDTIILGDRPWKIVHGAGHSPEHACLYNVEDKIFIAGDIVLSDITPNISFFPGNAPDHDPIDDYIKSVTAIRDAIPDDVLVLPSHGVPFRGLHKRIDELVAHHGERFEKIREICAEPQTAIEVMRKLFSHRNLGIHDLFFALGETMAHLVHDEKRQAIDKSMKNGVNYYRTK